MKKIYFFIFALYDPQVPDVSGFDSKALNPLGSTYASLFSEPTTDLVTRAVRRIIYDAAPEQYLDLKILNLGGKPEVVGADEFYYDEMAFGRVPITSASIGGGGIASGSQQVIPVQSLTDVNVDLLIKYPDGTTGVVAALTPGTPNTITVNAINGGTLPALAAASAGAYSFANHSPIEADGVTSIQQYFRQIPIERYNYVQLVAKAMRFGRMELFKYMNQAQFDNYLTMNKQRMIMQYRMDISNIYWNGQKGEVTLANGAKAKMAGGIYNLMTEAGSPSINCTVSNLPAALEELALDTEFKAYGYTRFLYGTPRALYNISQQYKSDKTRYTPDDEVAKLMLEQINIGSTKIVLVPMKRFEEPSCFPSSFRSRLFLVDQNAISAIQCWGEEMGETLSRVNHGNLNTFVDTWVSGTFSVRYHNPLGGGILNVTNLP